MLLKSVVGVTGGLLVVFSVDGTTLTKVADYRIMAAGRGLES
jgi:hypothetical protein